MASLDSLPADQRAVLQLVLQRGRSYDDIARMLSIDRAAVRDRALAALDALGPQTRVADERRALITDYLLGQLPGPVADQVRDRLAQSAAERAWARVITSELLPIASKPLPPIPDEAPGAAQLLAHEPETATPGPASAPPEPVSPPPPEPVSPPPPEPVSPPPPEHATPPPPRPEAPGPGAPEPHEPAAAPDEPHEPAPAPAAAAAPAVAAATAATPRPPAPPPQADQEPPAERRRSRVGGAILLGGGAIIVILIVFIVISLTGGKSSKHTSTAASNSTTTSASTPVSTATTSATTSTPVPVAQINLTSPNGTSKAKGVAEIVKQGTNTGILIVAQGLAANTTKPPNAYAVWLYNSPTDSKILGFVNPGVKSNGKLQTEGGLPTNASHYKELIVTLETQAKPTAPGPIVLQGQLTGV